MRYRGSIFFGEICLFFISLFLSWLRDFLRRSSLPFKEKSSLLRTVLIVREELEDPSKPFDEVLFKVVLSVILFMKSVKLNCMGGFSGFKKFDRGRRGGGVVGCFAGGGV